MTTLLHLCVLFAAFYALGRLNIIERRAAGRTRARFHQRQVWRATLKLIWLVLGLAGSILVVTSVLGAPLWFLPQSGNGVMLGLLAGAYLIVGSGLARAASRFTELRILGDGLWWLGRFIPWREVRRLDMDVSEIRIVRSGVSATLHFSAFFWDIDPAALEELVGSASGAGMERDGDSGSEPNYLPSTMSR